VKSRTEQGDAEGCAAHHITGRESYILSSKVWIEGGGGGLGLVRGQREKFRERKSILSIDLFYVSNPMIEIDVVGTPNFHHYLANFITCSLFQ
jgi:hypothetical protein